MIPRLVVILFREWRLKPFRYEGQAGPTSTRLHKTRRISYISGKLSIQLWGDEALNSFKQLKTRRKRTRNSPMRNSYQKPKNQSYKLYKKNCFIAYMNVTKIGQKVPANILNADCVLLAREGRVPDDTKIK